VRLLNRLISDDDWRGPDRLVLHSSTRARHCVGRLFQDALGERLAQTEELIVSGILGAAIPARRAAKVDCVVALRQE